MKITYLGHAAFLVEGEKIKALFGPFLTGNPLSAANEKEMTGITHIFVTHGHDDHIGDTEAIAKRCGSLVICNHELGYHFSRKGLKTHTMHIGGRIQMEFGTVKMVNALHGSGIITDKGMAYGGNPGGFVVEIEGKKIYHAGDTGLTKDMELLEEEDIYAAFLPVGGNYTMDVLDAVRAVGFIKPKITVPMHFNTFGLIKADPEKFREEASGTEVIVLKPGETLSV